MERKQIIGGMAGFLLLSMYSMAFVGFIKAFGVGSDSSRTSSATSSYSSSSSQSPYDHKRDNYAITMTSGPEPTVNTEPVNTGNPDYSSWYDDSSFVDDSSYADSSSWGDSSSYYDSSTSDSQANHYYNDFWYVDYENDTDTSSQSSCFEKIGIWKYVGSDTTVTVPGEVDGKPVTILRLTFTGNKSVSDVTVSDGPLTLDIATFQDCTALSEVKLPDTLKVIGRACFLGCNELRKINIPDSVTKISGGAFLDCVSLEEIVLPESLKILGSDAFYNTPKVTSLTIPKTVREIGDCAVGYYSKKVSEYDEIYERYYDTYRSGKLPGFTIYCYKDTAGHKYAIDNGFDYVLLDAEPAVTGEISGGAADLEGAEIAFTSSDGAVIRGDVDGAGFSADIPAGEYTVKVSKDGYAPREYTVTVGDEPVELDVEIHKYGDINGSGEIDAKDIAKAIDVSKGNSTFRDDYDRAVADVDGKAGFSAGDTAAFIAHGKGVKVIG